MTSGSGAKYPSPEEYEEILYRLIHADDGMDRLAAFLKMDEVWQAYLQVIVRRMRAQGYSWQEIADVLSITRQAAHARFSPHENENMPDEMYHWFDRLKAAYPRREGG
jgi:hypothetical protein